MGGHTLKLGQDWGMGSIFKVSVLRIGSKCICLEKLSTGSGHVDEPFCSCDTISRAATHAWAHIRVNSRP